jgi:chromate reductase
VAQQNPLIVLSFCNSPQMNAPEAYIQLTESLLLEDGKVTDAQTEDLLRRCMAEFHAFVVRALTVLPREDK